MKQTGEVQDKLKRLINASGLGIEAEDIVHDDSSKAALQLTSMQTGLSETEDSSLVWLRQLTQSP